MNSLFITLSKKCSKLTTQTYSTSFTLGIQTLDSELHDPIYSIYGFVRFADEIVDSFHEYDKYKLLKKFEDDCFDAIKHKISLNPILNSFQHVVNQYNIDHTLIKYFLESMYMDLDEIDYNQEKYEKYILGSAEVVGLMCLKVFVQKNRKLYEELKPAAQKLGSAFQKINFLRDLNSDYVKLGRIYFPNINMNNFNTKNKELIELDIKKDFKEGLKGIKKLPQKSRGGVYLAYLYYIELLIKIKKKSPKDILKDRIRINNFIKFTLLLKSKIQNQLNLI
tara:strand:- start:426 stop:1262 length:837 start_codon:yes stop_codon:yes gene_type:complete